MAMEMIVEAARMMGADRLVPIVSSHIDGCSKRYVATVGYGKARIPVPPPCFVSGACI